MKYSIKTLAECPEAAEDVDLLSKESWPEFLLHGNVTGWRLLFDSFSDFQLLFFDQDNHLAAVGHTVPITWNGENDDLPEDLRAIIRRATQNKEEGSACNAVTALAAMVRTEFRGQGMSRKVIEAMIDMGRAQGFDYLLAPLRPPMKSIYPLTPFEHYVEWKNANGSPFDPWIRVHLSMGAGILKIMYKSLKVEGTAADWESWAQMKFPESGQYVVKGALQPIEINVENNQGIYEEPNLWVCHEISR